MARDANGKFIKPNSGNEVASGSGDQPSIPESGIAGDSPIGIDPKTIDATREGKQGSEPESGKRKRGRQKGWRKTTADDTADLKEATPQALLDKSGIAVILLSIHEMAATALKASELRLTPDEAEKLSAASCNVAQHYNIAPSEKTQAWCALIMVVGMVYYPRITLIRTRLRHEQAQADAQQSVTA